jgi:Prophage endopeptidase tail
LLRKVNLDLKPSKMSIKLAKPDKEIIKPISHFKEPSLKLSLGRLNEVSFTIPYQIEKDHELIKNEVCDLLRNRYLLKVKWNHVTEWFVINEISDSVGDTEGLTVHAFSLGHELADKLITDLNETSITPEQALNKGLSLSTWSIGTIDPKIINKYRTFEVPEATLLDYIYTVATTFGVLVVFDTENQKVSLVHPDNYKINRGFKITYGQYLKSLNKTSNSDEMTTRLIVTGKDGLSINRINPTGANYIESFSYFLYPFQRDANKNVILSSDFMSDNLCHAILDYEELVESKKGEFSSLLDQLEIKQQSKSTKENELFTLETDLKIIEDEIYVLKATKQDYSTQESERVSKQQELDAKKSEISVVNTDIESIYSSIDAIKIELSIENNFTPEQIIERNRYIITKKWSDEYYIDDEELYNDAKVKFDDVRKPKINLTLGSVNFFQMISEQRNWDKMYLGDVIVVKHPMINVNYEVFLTDMEITDEDLNLTISDFQEIYKDGALLDKLNKSYSSSLSLEMSKYKWNETHEDLGEINDIINNTWDATKRRITAGVNESVEISNRGIIIRNPDFPNEIIIFQAGVMAISKDNGDTWTNVSNANGVFAETLMGKIIAGVNLYIENADGKFRFDKDGATIEGASFKVTDENGNNLLEVWNNAVGEGKDYNGVVISQENGIVVNRNDGKIQAFINATEGIKIKRKSGASWIDAFYADTNGVVNANGLVIKSNDGTEALINGNTKTIDFSKFTSVLGKVKANNIEIGSGTSFESGYDPSTKATTSDITKGEIYVRGTGYNRNASRILKINGQTIYSDTTGRGLRFTEIYAGDMHIINDIEYDVYGSESDRNALASRLNYIADNSPGRIVTLTSLDAIQWNSTLKSAVERIGGSYFPTERTPYALIGVAGLEKGAALQSSSSTSPTAPYAEITTKIIEGVPQGITKSYASDLFGEVDVAQNTIRRDSKFYWDSNGLRAIDPKDSSRYALLTSGGLEIKKGMVYVEREDGFPTIIGGKLNQSFDIFGSEPAFMVDTEVQVGSRFYALKTGMIDGICNRHTFDRKARYLKIQVALGSETAGQQVQFYVTSTADQNTWLGSASSTSYVDDPSQHWLTLDLGTPDGSEYAIYTKLRSSSSTNKAYVNIIRMKQTDFL